MDGYEQAFRTLNEAQKQAVEQIEGPVLVVAGPGTGKTQLLSMRVGSILCKDTTMLPSNILCLTFTDAAAANMRQRLIKLIGQDAYQVAIHTFNSFGSWIMNAYPDYFFAWREATTADELTTYRIIERILDKLPGDHILAAQSIDGTFFALKQLQNFMSDCKRANLQPDDVRRILDANRATYAALTPILNEHWPSAMRGKEAVSAIHACIAALEHADLARENIANMTDVYTLMMHELHAAQAEAETVSPAAQTKPFTTWKNAWLELDAHKQWAFKAAAHEEKLRAATDVYEQYQHTLARDGLVDFNDQIMTVLKALAEHDELRLNLQERFQYIMIDEYQDTNRAQLQMARAVTDAAVHEGRPNILVVGDDDQAIYRFQGADMSNIAAFEAAYRDPKIIALTENYRSNAHVLTHARKVSTQIALSLEKQKGVSKELRINVAPAGEGTQLHAFATESEQYAWIAEAVKTKLADPAVQGKEIAVLARERSQLDALVPYLRTQNVPIDYERRENVLQQEHVMALLSLARAVAYLHEQRLDEANALLPEILSHPMWHIEPADIWKIARTAHENEQLWFDIIFEQDNTPARKAADFLLGLSQQAAHVPLEQMLDALIGITEHAAPDSEQEDEAIEGELSSQFTKESSPFKQFYFGDQLFNNQPTTYLTLLSHLACLRRHLRNYQQSSTELLHLDDLITFVDAYQRAGLTMVDTAAHREDAHAVRLMTAHKAKGLEFDTVFVIGLTNDVWDKNKPTNTRFSYPRNLAEIKPSENDADDALRLLFVAMTRAQQTLHLCYPMRSEDGKEHQPFAPLLAMQLEADTPHAAGDAAALAQQYEQRWLGRHVSVDHASKHALLADRLQRYQLSATHFTNFLDVTRGGPLFFLTQNLLQFPSGQTPHAMYGVAMHETLRRAHEQVTEDDQLDIEKLIRFFKTKLATQGLSTHDLAHFLQQGEESLRAYIEQAGVSFEPSQRVEVDFRDQGVCVGEARLKGTLDLMDFDNDAKTIIVSDYKTGKAFGKWLPAASAPEYDRVKLHHYRQQLLFYKLLIDGSSEWGKHGWTAQGGMLRFVEPDYYGKIRTLDLAYDADELANAQELIKAVWRKIMALDFPDTNARYEPTLKGIQTFERDLIDGTI
ncbi:MAG TPA: ATP-dependent DNA helicase [Candidatus Saccharimonadales bacterium]|jgi:DNA helicase-2/ATP-dependent DNA helicase PcrA|nr:ATP-dependent DNA helicase [Candidatus Saccharimonadales bacterium]